MTRLMNISHLGGREGNEERGEEEGEGMTLAERGAGRKWKGQRMK